MCDTNITQIESGLNSYEKDFNKSQHNVGYKKCSPVWEFAEKINSEQSKCKLCSLIISSKGGTTTNIRRQILLQHRDTEEGTKLHLLVEKKKMNRKNSILQYLTQNITENTENLPEVMMTYLGEQYHCKVCGITKKKKHVMEKHIGHHLEENFEQTNIHESSHEIQAMSVRKKRSPVWEYAERLDRNRVLCRLCSKLVYSKGGSTTNIKSHILHKHRETEEGMKLKIITDSNKIQRKIEEPEGLQSKMINSGNPLKLKSPVWQFIEKLQSGIGKCKLCSHTGKRSDMTAHFLDNHQGTKEEAEIKMFQENKKIEMNKKEFKNFLGQHDTLNEDMNSEMEVSWQCKVCGEELQNKIVMEKHVNEHFSEEYQTC